LKCQNAPNEFGKPGAKAFKNIFNPKRHAPDMYLKPEMKIRNEPIKFLISFCYGQPGAVSLFSEFHCSPMEIQTRIFYVVWFSFIPIDPEHLHLLSS